MRWKSQGSDGPGLDPKRRAQLRAFLRIRCAASRRRAPAFRVASADSRPGLRREEVALLADVGVTWYTWLEQGRPLNVSAATLRRVSRALKLTRCRSQPRAVRRWMHSSSKTRNMEGSAEGYLGAIEMAQQSAQG